MSPPPAIPEPASRSLSPRILIADPDQRVLISLRDHLRKRGYEVGVARDGVKALESAITAPPDLIILETSLPHISAAKLTEIFRSNPRIEKTPILFVGTEDSPPEEMKTVKDGFIQKPLNPIDVTNQIDRILRRLRQVEEVYSGEKEITGTLTQIPLVDLLQVLTLNRREGKVIVNKTKTEICHVFVRDGVIVNAVLNEIEGEKALFRSLTWKTGKFEFVPIQVRGSAKIILPTGRLLLEGMRQADELERFSRHLPDPNILIKLKIDSESLPPGLRPINQEILLLLEFYDRVQDIVDHCSFPDYEVYRALHSLIRKGIVTEVEGEKASPEEGFILNIQEALMLKKANGERIRILFFSPSVEGTKLFTQALVALPEFRIEDSSIFDFKLGTPSLGPIGKIILGEGVSAHITALPLETEFRPLWKISSHDTAGALLFIPPGPEHHLTDTKAACAFLSELRFGPEHNEPRVIGVTEDRKRPQPFNPKEISASYSELKLERVFPLSPKNPALTREVIRLLLVPENP